MRKRRLADFENWISTYEYHIEKCGGKLALFSDAATWYLLEQYCLKRLELKKQKSTSL
jgi:hypothetical protein